MGAQTKIQLREYALDMMEQRLKVMKDVYKYRHQGRSVRSLDMGQKAQTCSIDRDAQVSSNREELCIRHWSKVKQRGYDGFTIQGAAAAVFVASKEEIRHEIKKERKLCSDDGCPNRAVSISGGVCIRHGAKRSISASASASTDAPTKSNEERRSVRTSHLLQSQSSIDILYPRDERREIQSNSGS